ncbi:MAG: exodeoxyribonuclease III [Pseudomonadota bacterium]
MKIASWNVNSIGARKPRILEWFDNAQPDVCVLQEIKCIDEKFPVRDFEDRGYNVHVHGQKTYNGVALLSKYPVDDIIRGVPAFSDEHSRYIEGVITPEDGAPIRVGGLYLPNGNPAPGPKYEYKLAWMAAFETHLQHCLTLEEASIFLGDYNVIPEAAGVYDPKGWADDALFRHETRSAFRRFLYLGYTEALSQIINHPFYTFWDYQRGAWPKDNGLRIDHLLLSPQALDRLETGGVDRDTRDPQKGDDSVKPSDHVPVWATFGV